jgi:hypothetical protein
VNNGCVQIIRVYNKHPLDNICAGIGLPGSLCNTYALESSLGETESTMLMRSASAPEPSVRNKGIIANAGLGNKISGEQLLASINMAEQLYPQSYLCQLLGKNQSQKNNHQHQQQCESLAAELKRHGVDAACRGDRSGELSQESPLGSKYSPQKSKYQLAYEREQHQGGHDTNHDGQNGEGARNAPAACLSLSPSSPTTTTTAGHTQKVGGHKKKKQGKRQVLPPSFQLQPLLIDGVGRAGMWLRTVGRQSRRGIGRCVSTSGVGTYS